MIYYFINNDILPLNKCYLFLEEHKTNADHSINCADIYQELKQIIELKSYITGMRIRNKIAKFAIQLIEYNCSSF